MKLVITTARQIYRKPFGAELQNPMRDCYQVDKVVSFCTSIMYDCHEHLKVWGNRLQVVDAYKTGGENQGLGGGWGGVVRGNGVGQVAPFI